LQQFAAILLPVASTVFHTDGSFLGNAMENGGKQNPETGFKSPRAEMPTFKLLFLKNLRSETLEHIQNLGPHRLMSD
jgi:hypothetical protein